jgi:hypothetical protein
LKMVRRSRNEAERYRGHGNSRVAWRRVVRMKRVWMKRCAKWKGTV